MTLHNLVLSVTVISHIHVAIQYVLIGGVCLAHVCVQSSLRPKICSSRETNSLGNC